MVLGSPLSSVGTCCEMSHCSHKSIASVRRQVIRKLDKHQTPQQHQPLLAVKAGTKQHQICAEDLPVDGICGN